MKKYIIGILSLSSLLVTSTADAHHPEISATTRCIDSTTYSVNLAAMAWDVWDDGALVTGDRRYNRDVVVSVGGEEFHGAFTPTNNYRFVVTITRLFAQGPFTASVTTRAGWGSQGQYEDDGQARTVVIVPPAPCGAPSTSTTVQPQAKVIERQFEVAEPVPMNPRFTG